MVTLENGTQVTRLEGTGLRSNQVRRQTNTQTERLRGANKMTPQAHSALCSLTAMHTNEVIIRPLLPGLAGFIGECFSLSQQAEDVPYPVP